MKNSRLKKYVIRFAAVFFLALAILTYFSKTIDNMLLPHVKTTELKSGRIVEKEDGDMRTHYLVPKSSVIDDAMFIAFSSDDNITVAKQVSVNICDSNEIYYEVTSSELGGRVIYSTSKEIENGGRVYIEEEQ